MLRKGQIAKGNPPDPPKRCTRIATRIPMKSDPKPIPQQRLRTSSVAEVRSAILERKRRSSLSQSCSDQMEEPEPSKIRKESISIENSTFDAMKQVSFFASPNKNKGEVQNGEEHSQRRNTSTTCEKSSLNGIDQSASPEEVTIEVPNTVKTMKAPSRQNMQGWHESNSSNNNNGIDESGALQANKSRKNRQSNAFKPCDVRYSSVDVDVAMFESKIDSEGKTNVAVKETKTPVNDEEYEQSTLNPAKLSLNIKLSHKLARKSPKSMLLIPHKLTFNTPLEIENEVIEISDENLTPDFYANNTFNFPRSSSVLFVKSQSSNDNKHDKAESNFLRKQSVIFLDSVPKYQMKMNRNSECVNDSVTVLDHTFVPTSKSEVSPDYEFLMVSESDESDKDESEKNVRKNLFQVEKEQPAEEKEGSNTFVEGESYEGNLSQSEENIEETEKQIVMKGDMPEGELTTTNEKTGKSAKSEETTMSDIEETDRASMDTVAEDISNSLSENERYAFKNKTLDVSKIIKETELTGVYKTHNSAKELSNTTVTLALENYVDKHFFPKNTIEADVSQIDETVTFNTSSENEKSEKLEDMLIVIDEVKNCIDGKPDLVPSIPKSANEAEDVSNIKEIVPVNKDSFSNEENEDEPMLSDEIQHLPNEKPELIPSIPKSVNEAEDVLNIEEIVPVDKDSFSNEENKDKPMLSGEIQHLPNEKPELILFVPVNIKDIRDVSQIDVTVSVNKHSSGNERFQKKHDESNINEKSGYIVQEIRLLTHNEKSYEIFLSIENNINFQTNGDSKQDEQIKGSPHLIKHKDDEITQVQISLPEVGNETNPKVRTIIKPCRKSLMHFNSSSFPEVLSKKVEIKNENTNGTLSSASGIVENKTGNESEVMSKMKGSRKRSLENASENASRDNKICKGLINVFAGKNNNNPEPKKVKRIRPTTIISDNAGCTWYVKYDQNIKLSM